MTITDKQAAKFDAILKRNGQPLKGKNLTERKHSLCWLFEQSGIVLSGSCAERMIKRGMKQKALVIDDVTGELRTLTNKERRRLRGEVDDDNDAVADEAAAKDLVGAAA